ncbi:GRAM-like protein [Cynara cardunculus var. scolymus]|uniref:GRAM-like protein n=1 Tax=Cynara cardunculus var. scolymus TaxID=59895 RepID=A0A118K2Y8_CYNCS|nr:GRAM-like protein [Cynara cardunculus var. scolymus]
MAMPRNRRTTSLRDSDSRLGDSDKIEGAGSWDAIEWTKIDQPVSRPVPHGLSDFLYEAEEVLAEGYGVLVNTDEAGTLFVTSFRLLFLSEGSRDIIALGTIPLATIEKFNKIKKMNCYNTNFVPNTQGVGETQVQAMPMTLLVPSHAHLPEGRESAWTSEKCPAVVRSLTNISSLSVCPTIG